MVQPRAITYPIRLTTPELAYLLAALHAETLIGGDDQALFPRDTASQDTLWRSGRDRLEADGWLVWDAAARNYQLSEELMELAAAMADPQVALLTRWNTPDGPRGVAHYLVSDYVVEMAREDQTYQVVALPAAATMAERLAHAIGFPDARPLDATCVLSRIEVEQAKQNPDPAWLEARGVPREAALLFAATLRAPAQSGTTTVLRTRLGKAVRMRLLGFMVAADGTAWLATPSDSDQVTYWTADAGGFTTALTNLIAELLAGPAEALHAAPGSR